MYHSLGGQYNPNSSQQRQPQPGDPDFRPPIAPGQGGYQQGGLPYDATGIPGQPPHPQQGGVQDLTSQMGGMAIAGDGSGTVRKKRDRHAYHEIKSSGSSQAFNGLPQGGVQPTQFLNQQAQGITPHPYTGEQATPAMSQFPAAASGPFTPGQQASQMEHAARPGAVSTQGKVDPEQLPSIPALRDGPAEYYLDNVFPTMEPSLIPPPAAIPFVSVDQGNSSPRFARLTMTHIPSSHDILQSTGLPLGLVIQPLAPLQEGEREIPILDFGEVGPPRCRRCRAYINPFMQFKSGGGRFVCNMCNFPNEVPNEYFAPITPQGVRVDREQRPELMLGTVEFIVPKEYWSKEPVPIRWLFLIDVTEESVNKGFLTAFCDGIINALYGGEQKSSDENEPDNGKIPAGAKVGIVTFDKQMHFYNIRSNLEHAQMMVMPDLDDPFVPLSEGLFVDPHESKAIITSLLTQLPQMFSPDIHTGLKNPEPALLPALNAATSALVATGGKIICSLGALPTWGPGRLFLRDENTAVAGTDAEKKLLTTEHPGYHKAADKMTEAGIGIDFFLAAPSGGYLDIATIGTVIQSTSYAYANITLGHVAARTGGETYYYPNFHSPRDDLKLSKEINHTVTRATGFQALMKVRCSNGLQISGYHGNFTHHTFGADLEFGSIDQDKAISVMFSYDGKLDPKLDAHFQSALLYTSGDGQRRVRCHNLVASVAAGGDQALQFVDQDAVISVMSKEAATRIPERLPKDVRNMLTEKAVDILAAYRKNFSGHYPAGQLVIPEHLKGFSMEMLGLIKSRAFKAGREPTDRRVHELRLVRSMGPLELSLYLYPRIISIHNLDDKDGFPNEKGHLRMPHCIRASFSKVQEGGVYIVDNGQICLLWLHAQVSPHLLEDLFGPEYSSLQSLDPFISQLPVLETHLNAQVRNILQYMEMSRGSKALTIQLARQGFDGAEYEFARLLYEDRNNEAQSYVDWLVHVHRLIQMEVRV